MRWALVVLALASCGRLGFDDRVGGPGSPDGGEMLGDGDGAGGGCPHSTIASASLSGDVQLSVVITPAGPVVIAAPIGGPDLLAMQLSSSWVPQTGLLDTGLAAFGGGGWYSDRLLVAANETTRTEVASLAISASGAVATMTSGFPDEPAHQAFVKIGTQLYAIGMYSTGWEAYSLANDGTSATRTVSGGVGTEGVVRLAGGGDGTTASFVGQKPTEGDCMIGNLFNPPANNGGAINETCVEPSVAVASGTAYTAYELGSSIRIAAYPSNVAPPPTPTPVTLADPGQHATVAASPQAVFAGYIDYNGQAFAGRIDPSTLQFAAAPASLAANALGMTAIVVGTSAYFVVATPSSLELACL
jgi:hypothetical protein